MRGEPFTGRLEKPQSRAAEKKRADREAEKAWLAVRKAVLVRDSYRCRCCGSADKVDVHHIRFRSRGGADTTENLAALCRVCHCELHAYRVYVEGADANKRLRFVWER